MKVNPKDKSQWIHSIRWTHPRREPPEGMPRVLLQRIGQPFSIAEIQAVYPAYKLGCGYAHCTDFPEKPVKHLDPETRRRKNERRKKTLEANRVKKHLPLLADIIIRDEGLDWRAEA